MIRVAAFLLASFALTLRADPPQVEKMLLGSWKGGACVGTLAFKADGTFERGGYSPGGNRLQGTWKMNWDGLPPTLTLTCTQSDDPYFVGRPHAPRVLELANDRLSLIYLSEKTAWPQGSLDGSNGEWVSRYKRVK
jgi:hypothetical protein